MPINWSNLITRNPVTGAFRAISPQLLAEAYLIPKAEPPNLAEAVDVADAPWSESYSVAPEETLRVIERSLRTLMGATKSLHPEEIDPTALPEGRARLHLTALLALWQNMGALPEEFHIIQHVLATDTSYEPLPLLDIPAKGFQCVLEKALFDKLVSDHGLLGDADVREFQTNPEHADGNSLAALQAGIDNADAPSVPLDSTLRFFGIRDIAAEADLAAGIVRRGIDDGEQASDYAILLPDVDYGLTHFRSAFERAGIPLSGLPELNQRDSATETMRLCILALQKPVPPMVMASLCLSPLMSWSAEEGRGMARELMDRGYRKSVPKDFLDLFARMPGTGKELMAILGNVAVAIPGIKNLVRVVGAICAGSMNDAPDWPGLLQASDTGGISVETPQRWVEGVTIGLASSEPWRNSKHLIVAGFVGDAYPKRPGTNAMFLDSELEEINQSCGLRLPTYADALQDRLGLFSRQIRSASESITFLTPYRDLAGKALAPATGLALVAGTIANIRDPGDLIVDLHALDPVAWPCASASVEQTEHLAPVLPDNGIITLDQDLLRLRAEDDGRMKPQSPSRLETLLVSPLAWVMNELDMGPAEWQPEGLDILNQGSLFHSIFELLFEPGEIILSEIEIAQKLPEVFVRSVAKEVPFLAEPVWGVERAKLEAEALQMVLHWRQVLLETGASVIANEAPLRGEALGLRLRGIADTILELPNGQKLIVDFKTSKSGKRRDRMMAGWDLQIALYRSMLLRPEEGDKVGAISGNTPPAIAYHLLRDGGTLASGDGFDVVAPDIELLSNDISEYAMDHLVGRIAELGTGRIALNKAEDAQFFEKTAHLSAYALSDNPLITAFTLPEGENGDE